MKPYRIDLEKVGGAQIASGFIQVEAALTVQPDPSPLQGVHESRLVMSLESARQLHNTLTLVLDAIRKLQQQG